MQAKGFAKRKLLGHIYKLRTTCAQVYGFKSSIVGWRMVLSWVMLTVKVNEIGF